MQTGLEKNLFGSHPVSLPAAEPRGPPPAFASDPLMHISASGGREYGANSSPSVTKDAEGYSAATGIGPPKPSSIDIVEIDGPSSANPSLSNHEANFMKSTSPGGVSGDFYLFIYYIGLFGSLVFRLGEN